MSRKTPIIAMKEGANATEKSKFSIEEYSLNFFMRDRVNFSRGYAFRALPTND